MLHWRGRKIRRSPSQPTSSSTPISLQRESHSPIRHSEQVAPGPTALLEEKQDLSRRPTPEPLPSQVVVADCRIFDTFATDGGHILLQSLSAGAAHDVDDLPRVDGDAAGLPFNDGIGEGRLQKKVAGEGRMRLL